MNPLLFELMDAIIDGQAAVVQERIKQSLSIGLDPAEILNTGMIVAMAEVGHRFENGDFYVPEMLIAARAMQAGLGVLKPYLQDAEVRSMGKVVIGTVRGDLHDIGKNLVAMMLEGAGFDVKDLGTDVPPEKFVDAVRVGDVDIVAFSALLTTTMPFMKSTIEALKIAGLRDQVKIIVGGAPITEQYAEMIGADGYSSDASRAVNLAKGLVG